MTDYDNTNSGALFKNDKGDNPNRPDYTGELNVEGKEMRIAAWLKTSKAGNKFMSLSVSEKENTATADFDDDTPF